MPPSPPLDAYSFQASALDLQSLVSLGVIGLLAIAFFWMSFTDRYGRSRWPLHLLIGLGICVTGIGVTSLASNIVQAIEPEETGLTIPKAMNHLYHYGLCALSIGLLAMIRALYGIFKEPGPRY